MIRFLSLSSITTGLGLAYSLYSIWSICTIFSPPECKDEDNCLKSYLRGSPDLDLCIFFSEKHDIRDHGDIQLLDAIHKFDYSEPWERKLSVNIPENALSNGTFYFHVFVIPSKPQSLSERCSRVDLIPDAVSFRIRLTRLHVPDSFFMNLLNEDASQKGKLKVRGAKGVAGAVPHLKGKVTINMLTDTMLLPKDDIPIELYEYLKITKNEVFLPIVIYNFLETKIENLRLIKNPVEEVILKYEPIYFGKLRFILNMKEALTYLKKMGFSSRDLDDIKGIFAGTNLVLLSLTMCITTFHVLFDFLAFKNDIKFWREKSTMEGLSSRLVLWRAFSQTIICLYLYDEEASLLVLVPSAIATAIEYWKVFKFTRRRYSKESLEEEIETIKYDTECMRYISYVLYPLCIGGAIYSLIYKPHKSWYSWCIHSLVNGVYAFGFLFMLPQLFINYKLKSVEALPWKSLMYKAFNTFIDDFFAFLITMPTAHRVACFRDDIVFMIYLYQRWLYPVDKSRKTDSKGGSKAHVPGKKEKKEKKERKEGKEGKKNKTE